MDRDSGRSRGFAFVTMDNDAEGQAAITALGGKQFEGRALTVRKAEPKPAAAHRRRRRRRRRTWAGRARDH